MNQFGKINLVIGILILLQLTHSLFAEDNAAEKRLKKQAEQFPEKIVKVAEGVYTAVGYSVSNDDRGG